MTRSETNSKRTARHVGCVALAAALLGGCIVDAGGDVDVIDTADSQLYATWYTIDESGFEIDCHAVADVVRISSFNRATGEVFIDVFDCAAEEGTTATLPRGDYDVDVDLVLCNGQPCDVSPYIVDGFTTPVLVDRRGALFDIGDFELVAPGPSI